MPLQRLGGVGDMPTPKSQQKMLAKYRHLDITHRMQLAADKVIDEGVSQSEAARTFGVSRPRLNQHVQNRRRVLAEQQARSTLAREERQLPAESCELPRPLVVMDEQRRVPPFPEFARRYFGNRICPDCNRHHTVPGFHDEIMSKVTDPALKRQLFNLPPYHAKSTVGTVDSTVYELCRDPNSRTLIVSKAQRLAERFLYAIVKHLTDPALYYGAEANLIEDWGPFQGSAEQWNRQQIYVTGRGGGEKDPSVSCLGVGGAIYGVRADRIIFDDIADLENQKNIERVKEMLTWTTQEAASRVGQSGKLIFFGTRISAGDIYSELEKLPSFDVVRYPCILDEEQRTTLWGDHFGFDAAVEMRGSMTPEQWQLVYQNVDTPGFGADFPSSVIELCRDDSRIFGAYDSRWALVAGLDPAGAGEQSGYTALVLWGVDMQTGMRYLVDFVNAKQLKAPQLKDAIFDWADRYPLRELRVESNGLQSQLVQYNQEILARMALRGVRVASHITTGHNKYDPNFGVQSMAPLFFNRQVSLPYGDMNSRNRLRTYEEQFTGYPMARVSDLVMATWFAELGARDVFQRAAAPMFDNRRHLPNRIMRNRRVFDFATQRVTAPNDAAPQPGRPLFLGGKMMKPKKLTNVAGEVLLPDDTEMLAALKRSAGG